MSYKRLGDYIQVVDGNKNSELEFRNLLGINISNNFMPSVANRNGLDLSKYKIVRKRQFATNIMHVGRDERLPVALYDDNVPAIVSPAYKVFEVVDENELLPEYLMIEFQRAEFHRLAWYYCDSSVRGGLEWDRLCDIQLPIPDDIDEQRKYVNLYRGLLKNQNCYEKSLDDLQLICNSFMDTLKGQKLEPIGDYIDLIDNRNLEGKNRNLLGININKEFMPSKAKANDDNIHKYKIITKNEFAYSPMQVGRDETVRVVLYSNEEPAIISPAYSVFRVTDNEKLLPEFLMLWFYRPEFNRYGWFISDSSVRSSLEWYRFCDIKIPIPDLKIQEAIVTIYHTLETRKRLNEELKAKTKPLCPVLMRGVIENNLKPQAV